MRKRIAMGVLAILGLSVLLVEARADEEKVAFDKLPKAVKKTIKHKFPKAEIEGASKEVENGTTTYEVELEIKEHSVNVALKADGTILEIEREVPANKLPKAVKKALAARYPGAKIEKVEEVVKGEYGPVHYEVAIKAKVLLTAKGKVIKGGEDEGENEKPSAKAGKSKKEHEEDEDDDEEEEHEHGHGAKARKGEHHEVKAHEEHEEHHEKSSAKAKKSKQEQEEDEDDDEEEHEHGAKAKKGEHHEGKAVKGHEGHGKKEKKADDDDDEDDDDEHDVKGKKGDKD